MTERSVEERFVEIKEMPSKELLEDYLMGNSGPIGVTFNPQEGIFRRSMPRQEWLEYRRKTREQEMNYSNKIREEMQRLINYD